MWGRNAKGISVVWSLLFVLPAFSAVVQLTAGDVDGSRRVDAVDIQLVINAALDIPGIHNCDIDYSGEVDAVDIQLVINAALGLTIDEDGDGLCDAAESNLETWPEEFDTDGDGIGDGQEVLDGTDPLVFEAAVVPGQIVYVPGGSFEMGDPWDEGWYDEVPVHTVTLSPYAIGRYEVTNREYVDMLNWALAQGYLDVIDDHRVDAYGQHMIRFYSRQCQIGYSGARFVVKGREGHSMALHPVVHVSWYGAAAYCNWLSEIEHYQPCYDTSTWACDFSKNGYHLPTEAQWERAAAWDGARHWRYAFAYHSIDDCSRANCSKCNPLGLSSTPYTSWVRYYDGINAGTHHSISPVGCYDMTGNVFEWCHDRYGSTYYQRSPEMDPTGPASGLCRVQRGGGWEWGCWCCRSAFRESEYSPPHGTWSETGFRLARQLLFKDSAPLPHFKAGPAFQSPEGRSEKLLLGKPTLPERGSGVLLRPLTSSAHGSRVRSPSQ